MSLKKGKLLISWSMALIILFTAFTPLSTAMAVDVVSAPPTIQNTTDVSVEGDTQTDAVEGSSTDPHASNAGGTISEGSPEGAESSSTSAPTVGDGSSSAPAPTEGEGSTSTPAPAEGESSSSTPAPAEGESSSSTPAPTEGEGSTSTPAPAEGEGSTSTPAPAEGESSSSTPAPAEGESSSSTPAPAEGDSSSSTPAPTEGEGSSSTPAPIEGEGSSSTPAPIEGGASSSTPIPTLPQPPLLEVAKAMPAAALFAGGGRDITSILSDVTLIVEQNGKEIVEGVAINSTDPITVEISFRVPVFGDDWGGTPDQSQIVLQNDTALFELSNAFSMVSNAPFVMKKGDVPVGTVNFVTDETTKMVSANILFDGTEVFSDPSYHTVIGRFNATLNYDASGSNGSEGDHYVTILGKNFTVTVPPIPSEYTMKKTGERLPDQTIAWTVTVEATKGGNHVDLNGKEFFDALSAAGEYVPNTFAITGYISGDAYLNQTELSNKNLSYTFAEGAISPKTITFRTRISDESYYANEKQTSTNTAWLRDGQNTYASATDSVSFTPKWISKTGVSSDQAEGVYNPKNRTITWTIIANQMAAVLRDVVITDVLDPDLTFQSATWALPDASDPTGEAWVEQGAVAYVDNKFGIPGDSNGYVTTPVRITIVTGVKDEDFTAKTKEFYNSGSIRWEGLTGAEPSVTSPGVTIGYPGITKSGVANPANRTVKWMVTVDTRGQVIPDPKVYDLLVHVGESDFDISQVTLPTGIVAGDLKPQFYQKYAGGFDGGATGLTVHVEQLMQGGKHVADLLEVRGFVESKVNTFSFDSMVLDPNIFAGNKSKTVENSATLFSGNTKITEATAKPTYKSSVLAKELIHRDGVLDPINQVNNRTTNLKSGFHYIDKSAIFRLVVNADGLDMTGAIDASGNVLGAVTLTDTLPTGWEFVPLEGKEYLIFEGNTLTNGIVEAIDTTPDDVAGLTTSISGGVATFTFDTLTKPYVILVKAKPNDETLAGYFDSNDTARVTNNLKLTTQNWTPSPDVSVTRQVEIDSQLLEKTYDIPEAGVLLWKVEYKPYDLQHTGTIITDTLPVGLDLRTDSAGNLLLTDNIAAYSMKLNADGSYTLGEPVALELGGNLSYDSATRTLSFKIPDSKTAYRLTYITDITGDPGEVENKVSLSGGTLLPNSRAVPYMIRALDAQASMERSGYLKITKTKGDGNPLDGAEFTLYALDGTTIIRRSVSNTSGIIWMKVLPDGEYLLRETKAPTGYLADPVPHTVKVQTVGTTVVTSIDGKTGADSNLLTVRNYQPDTTGKLTVSKTLGGNGGDVAQKFDFTITFTNAPDSYPYTVYSNTLAKVVESGEIRSGEKLSLAHEESATIVGLPNGATYTVVEGDYTAQGYVTTYTGDSGIIAVNTTQTATFTNTKYKPGSLMISKIVAGDGGSTTKSFEFTVKFSGDQTKVYPYTGIGVSDGNIKSGGTVSLAHNQSITITGLPKDTQYEVIEKDYIEDGYTTVSKDATGLIVTDEIIKAEFTNTRQIPGTLTIQKTVEGMGDTPQEPFDFTVRFNNAPNIANPYKGNGVADGVIKSGERISLAHGQSITIGDLPPNAEYEVTEADYTHKGYVVNNKVLSGTISSKIASAAAFVNYKPGNLTLTKTVDGNVGDRTKKFDFTVTLEGTDRIFTYVGTGVDNGTIKSGDTISLAHGESITIKDIPKDTAYRITEADYRREGYVVTSTGAEGLIIAGNEHRAEFTNTKNWYPSDDESTGNLRIKKTVTGRYGDQEQEFTFVVKFSDTFDESFYYTGSKIGHIKSGQKISLAHDEQVEILGIPVGTGFTVTEVEANKDGYYTTSTGATGKMGELGRTAAFVNTKSGVPNTGDDSSNSKAKVGLFFFSVALVALIGLDTYLRRKKNQADPM